MNVVAIVPTHQRFEVLKNTIQSLQAQTHSVRILVALDNCTDRSEEICKEAGVEYFHTVANKYRKSGAQNQALGRLDLAQYDAVLMMDDDTVLDPNLIQVAVCLLHKKPELAAVCSRADILPASEESTAWQKILWHMQNVEYGTFNAHRIETRGSIMVVHGMCALFRMTALLQVLENRSECYRQDNITEDYELTLTLKELGWKVQSSMHMHAWTEVPLSLVVLWKQRVRWFRGGLDCLRDKGINQATWKDVASHWLFWIFLLVQLFIGYFVTDNLLRGGSLAFSSITVVCVVLAQLNALYRLSYVSKRSWVSVVICIALLPDLLYTWFRIAQTIYAYYLSFSNHQQSW